MGYKNGIKRVTKMEWIGLQEWNGLSYKNSKKRYPQNGLTSVECILDLFPQKHPKWKMYILIQSQDLLACLWIENT